MTIDDAAPLVNVDQLAHAAAGAARLWRHVDLPTRAAWLEAVADALDEDRAELVEIAHAETALPVPRLEGEVARTSGQLRLLAEAVADGSLLEIIVDDEDPVSSPPRPGLRRMLTGVGPVAVFAASNFPFAFSVCGGDTASAWAAGNPVIVKAHSGHPRLARRTAEVAIRALARAGAPEHSLALVEGRPAGNELVGHPLVQAAAFTGSLAGGRALFDLAVRRPDPIPFYGELGSLNPVVITSAAVARRGPELARGLVSSATLGVGQFCTKPGVVFVPAGEGFEADVRDALSTAGGGRMLTSRIADDFRIGVDEVRALPDVQTIGQGPVGDGAVPIVLGVDVAALERSAEVLLAERFGPFSLLVRYRDEAELLRGVALVPPGLTATIHAEATDELDEVQELLAARAGRILFDGWPTGVAVTWSQHHGGPWPATTSLFTSVGVTAVRRFQRPVVFQDAPDERLPRELRDAELPFRPHRRNGALVLPYSPR